MMLNDFRNKTLSTIFAFAALTASCSSPAKITEATYIPQPYATSAEIAVGVKINANDIKHNLAVIECQEFAMLSAEESRAKLMQNIVNDYNDYFEIAVDSQMPPALQQALDEALLACNTHRGPQ